MEPLIVGPPVYETVNALWEICQIITNTTLQSTPKDWNCLQVTESPPETSASWFLTQSHSKG
jgi:hypothetical protein